MKIKLCIMLITFSLGSQSSFSMTNDSPPNSPISSCEVFPTPEQAQRDQTECVSSIPLDEAQEPENSFPTTQPIPITFPSHISMFGVSVSIQNCSSNGDSKHGLSTEGTSHLAPSLAQAIPLQQQGPFQPLATQQVAESSSTPSTLGSFADFGSFAIELLLPGQIASAPSFTNPRSPEEEAFLTSWLTRLETHSIAGSSCD